MQKRFYNKDTASSRIQMYEETYGEKLCVCVARTNLHEKKVQKKVNTGVSCVAFCMRNPQNTSLWFFLFFFFYFSVAWLLLILLCRWEFGCECVRECRALGIYRTEKNIYFCEKPKEWAQMRWWGKWCFVISQVTNGNDAQTHANTDARDAMRWDPCHIMGLCSVSLEVDM